MDSSLMPNIEKFWKYHAQHVTLAVRLRKIEAQHIELGAAVAAEYSDNYRELLEIGALLSEYRLTPDSPLSDRRALLAVGNCHTNLRESY